MFKRDSSACNCFFCKQVFPIFKGRHLSSQACKKMLGLDRDNFIKVCQRTEYRRYCGQLWPDFMPWVVLCGFLLCENWISPKNKVYLFFKEKGFLLWASAFPCILPPALLLHQNQNHSLVEIPVNKKFTFEAKFWILKKLYFFPGKNGHRLPQLPDRVPKNLSRIWEKNIGNLDIFRRKRQNIVNLNTPFRRNLNIREEYLTWDILLWETSPSRAVYRTPWIFQYFQCYNVLCVPHFLILVLKILLATLVITQFTNL